MPNMTLSVPADVHRLMRRHPEIRWSEVARRAIIQKLMDLERMDELTHDSKMTEQDAIELGRIVNKSLARRYRNAKKDRTG
jgi:predicted nucleic acid-binding protein